MREIIESVLQRHRSGLINLNSKASCESLAAEIAAVLENDGTYFKSSEMDKQMAREREKWVCSICGKNTFNVEYDYIGSGTNHLGCELQEEQSGKSIPDQYHEASDMTLEQAAIRDMNTDNAAGINPNDDSDWHTGPDGHYERYGDIPHALNDPEHPIPEYDPQTGQKNPLYEELIAEMEEKVTEMEQVIYPWHKERSKLSDQLMDISEEEPRYIYESPDSGKTIYRRPFGNYDPTAKELVKSPDRDISFTSEF